MRTKSNSIALASYPVSNPNWIDEEAESLFAILQAVVIALRQLKCAINFSSPKISATLICDNDEIYDMFDESLVGVKNLAKIEELEILHNNVNPPQNCLVAVVPSVQVFLHLPEDIDVNEQKKSLDRKMIKLSKNIAASKKKLDNKQFIEKAPQEIVEGEKDKLSEMKNEYAQLQEYYNIVSTLD